jgi:hypothetical protein
MSEVGWASQQSNFERPLGSINLTDVYRLVFTLTTTMPIALKFVESFRVEGVIHLLGGLSVFDTSVATLMAAVSKQGWVCSVKRTSFV